MRAGLSVGSLLSAAALVFPVSAHASPLDPGLFANGDNAAYCSAPVAAPGQPGWSQVTCGVGARQFVVAPRVHVLRVTVFGARGGSGGGGAPGGAGEEIRAAIMVSPGERLEMAVGGVGTSHEVGGFNGGGDGPRPGAQGRTAAGGGGGSSDIRVGAGFGGFGPWTRIISAAGGGGGGGSAARGPGVGGNGGRNTLPGRPAPGLSGGPGGLPATYTGSGAGGGSGPRAGAPGSTEALIGGAGGTGDAGGGDGGAGGGGYGFGGGGAGGAAPTGRPAGGGGGGGGGSSFLRPSFLVPGSTVGHVPGAATGSGSIVVTYQAPPIQCGQTIYRSMTLTTDLDCRGSSGLILGGQPDEIADSGLVFDLGGHTIRGDSSETGIDLHLAGSTVRNGTLRGFGTGISEHGLDGRGLGGPSVSVTNIKILNGVRGVVAAGDTGGISLLIDHTTISGMSEIGIDASADAIGLARVTNTTVTHSAAGIVAEVITAVLDHDVLTGNTGAGVFLNVDTATVTSSTLVGNGSGITVASLFAGQPGIIPDEALVTVTGNTVRASAGTGMALIGRAAAGSVLTGNHLSGNGFDPPDPAPGTPVDPGDGILVTLVDPAGDLLVGGNAARGNADWGIDAVGVTDGGGNLASGNHPGNDCRGVVCAAQ